MKKILIVDDDPSIGNLLQETLTGAGYCAMRAYSGTEALLTVANTKPDLVLLDLMLPGLSGEELLPRLQEIRPASACPLPARSSSKCTARFLQGTRTTNYTLIFFFGNNLAATTCRHGYDFAIFVQVSRRDAFYLKNAVTVSKGERAVIKGISFPMLLVGLAAFYTGNVRHHAHPK